jgi:hypothetical protein
MTGVFLLFAGGDCFRGSLQNENRGVVIPSAARNPGISRFAPGPPWKGGTNGRLAGEKLAYSPLPVRERVG